MIGELLRSDLFRFLAALVLLAVAGLTTFPAPTEWLWKLSVAATEGGHWVAIGALLVAVPRRGQHAIGKISSVMCLGAVALFVLPIFHAQRMNKDLPARIDTSFGTDRRERGRYAEDPRPEPLVVADLVSSVHSRPVRLEERVFSAPDGEKLTLDVFRPGYEHGPLPGVLVIHGGSWQTGNSREFLALNGYLAARDYVVASINYRLAPKWRFPAGRDDVLAAIAYLKVYGKDLGIDATRLVLLGRSAGGQLALLAAYTAGEPAIKGVVSIYGPTDLRFGYEHPASRQLIDPGTCSRRISVALWKRRMPTTRRRRSTSSRQRRRRHCLTTASTTATSRRGERGSNRGCSGGVKVCSVAAKHTRALSFNGLRRGDHLRGRELPQRVMKRRRGRQTAAGALASSPRSADRDRRDCRTRAALNLLAAPRT